MIATLFLVTTATGLYGVAVVEPILDAPDYLVGAFTMRGGIALGAVLLSITTMGIVFIAVFAFPLLRKLDETLAVGYLTTRIIGGAVMMFGIAAILVLIPLSEMYIEIGSPDGSSYQVIGDALLALKLVGLTQLSLPLLALGGMILCWQMWQFKLVPGGISGVGFVGYGLVFLGGVASWFGVVDATPFGSASSWPSRSPSSRSSFCHSGSCPPASTCRRQRQPNVRVGQMIRPFSFPGRPGDAPQCGRLGHPFWASPEASDKMKSGDADLMSFAVFGSKWALPIACMLRGQIMRFSALLSAHGAISQKMLSNTLKLLEQQGLVERRHYPSIPPRVEYNLTQVGEEVIARLVPLGTLIAEARSRASADRQQRIIQNHQMW